MKKQILVIDDEVGARESLRETFYKLYEVFTAENALEGLAYLSRHRADLVILDLIMPKLSGVKFLKEARELYPDIPIIGITASSDENLLRDVLSLGAVGIVRKPYDLHELRHLVKQSLSASELPRQRELLEKEVSREFPLGSPVGRSPAFRRVLEHARAAISDHALLVGERGTGKEHIARQIHSWSDRADEPFVAVACGELPPAFLEAEIFGSWNNAGHGRRGAIDLARGSSLFLENINRLPKQVQHSLLRLVKSGEYQRTGSQQIIPAAVRVLATLQMSVAEAVQAKAIIPELVDVFSLHTISIPPLRERREDIPTLAYHFLQQLRSTLNVETLDIEAAAMQRLRDYSWPGNVRELRNVIERMLVLHGEAKQITPSGLPQEFFRNEPPQLEEIAESGDEGEDRLDKEVKEFQRRLIAQALEQSSGTLVDAAKVLGTTTRKLQYRIDKLRIKRSPFLRE